MKQTGYIIENLLDKKTYFTSTSAYDRPKWVKVNEATVYVTADIAEASMKKLIRYGVNSIRMVPVSEALSLELPPEELPTDLPPVDGEDAMGADDEMHASNQEEVCPECEHEPCTCGDMDHEQGEEIDVDSLPPSDDLPPEELPPTDELPPEELPPEDEFLPREEEELTHGNSQFTRGHHVTYKGQTYVVTGDVGNGILQLASAEDPKKVIRANSAELLPVHESTDETCLASDADSKISVPSDVKSALANIIKTFSTEAETYNGRDDARSSFAMTVAGAASELKDLLDQGTVDSIKQAQIKLSSLMSPITSNFPAVVLKFINNGGRKMTLKDFFDSKRDQTK